MGKLASRCVFIRNKYYFIVGIKHEIDSYTYRFDAIAEKVTFQSIKVVKDCKFYLFFEICQLEKGKKPMLCNHESISVVINIFVISTKTK